MSPSLFATHCAFSPGTHIRQTRRKAQAPQGCHHHLGLWWMTNQKKNQSLLWFPNNHQWLWSAQDATDIQTSWLSHQRFDGRSDQPELPPPLQLSIYQHRSNYLPGETNWDSHDGFTKLFDRPELVPINVRLSVSGQANYKWWDK